MQILIGGAWPYANGSLHIGHIAALVPGDVLARYHRAAGDQVYYVSGSDCHGTPVAIRAREEGVTPRAVSDRYHREFVRVFDRLGFSYDRYGKTSDEEHIWFVRSFHHCLYKGDYTRERETPRAYCRQCNQFLADRFVRGRCPHCGAEARGDQCEACGGVLEPENLAEPVCALCGRPADFIPSRHLYLTLGALEKELTAYLDARPHWRKNAQALSRRYIAEGLPDRAMTRDLDWGIDVPRAGYEDKKIYIWAENVLGYLSMSRAAVRERGGDYAALWDPEGDCRHYYVHGKDNIPFHTVILPALLLASGRPWRLPDVIVSSEYMTLEGRKISTSGNWALWAEGLLDRYDPDAIRYFLLSSGPERRDADFSWRAFIHGHNGELLGAWGNLVNRTLAFVAKYQGGQVPEGALTSEDRAEIEGLYPLVGGLIRETRFKDAIDTVFAHVRRCNRLYDDRRPWETRTADPASCRETLYLLIQAVGNLAVLLEPFTPFSSRKVLDWLGLEPVWRPQWVPAGHPVEAPELLFQRIDKAQIQREEARLGT